LSRIFWIGNGVPFVCSWILAGIILKSGLLTDASRNIISKVMSILIRQNDNECEYE
jgi:hypothetical protein